jgi:hypothetical protein
VVLQRLLRLKVDTALVLPTGLAFAAAASWAAFASAEPRLFVILVGLVDLALFLPLGPWRTARGPSLGGALPALAATLALLATTQYGLNRRDARGDFLLDDLERIDTAFHVAVTWEVANSWPPQVPGLAGVPLRYHLAPHLIRAAAWRFAGTTPYDAMYRYDVTLWAVALVLALRAAARALGGGSVAVALAGFTPLFADFSFLYAGLKGSRWWSELFGGNLLLSLVFANSLVPALALALGAVIALGRARDEGRRGWLWLAVLLAAAVPYFKVFLAAPLCAGLLAAALVPGAALLAVAVALPCALATALLVAGSGSPMQVFLDPFAPVLRTRQLLGLETLEGARLLFFVLAWLPAALGLRLFAVPSALRALRSRALAPVVIGVMALCGWPIALLLRLTADRGFNEAVYFSVASGALLWLFFALACERTILSGKSTGVVLALTLVLALPTTAEFVWRKFRTPPDVVPARVFEAMARLSEDSRPGDVVLMRPYSRFPPPPVVFLGRRLAYTIYLPYMRQFAPQSLLRARSEDLRAFFRTDDAAEARAIAARLQARHVFLQGSQAMGRGARAIVEPLYLNKDTALYRLRPPE